MPITWGHEILAKLKAAGIVPSTARRVIIDISMRSVVEVHYWCYGDQRLSEPDFEEILTNALKEQGCSVTSEPTPSAPAETPVS